MKKIRIVARQMIVNPITQKVHSDEGLRALDGYFEDIIDVPKQSDLIGVIMNYEEEHPELKGWDFQIEELV